jgi:hypothetical protein
MAGGPEELLRQVEEAREASSAFDRRVAMSMAIVAAMLALVTMLGHRAHNETLRLQAEANHLRTQANIYHTEASDQWTYYQAKNIRSSEDQFFLALLSVIDKQPGPDAARRSAELRNQWDAETKRYQQRELPALRAKAQALEGQARQSETAAERAIEASYEAHHQGDRLDYAELGVELSLVLMSLAVLTKREPFWYAGIVAGAVGVAIAGWAVMLG